MNDVDLREHGPCIGHAPAIFFPEAGQVEQGTREIRESCPMRAACLDQALARREPYGIWGGTTPAERRRMTAS